MPTYEYACKGCGEHLEVVQSFKDDALTECPACGGTLRKVFSAAGIIFKGSGWYSKDYASSSSSASSEGKTDSKPDGATKSDTSTSDGAASTSSDASSSSSTSSSDTSSEARSA